MRRAATVAITDASRSPRRSSKDGEIYLHAERVVLDRGAVVFISNKDCPMPVLPAGLWSAVYAASLMDGSAVAVEQWAGEVI